MKRISILTILILSLVSCNDSDNKFDINDCISLFRSAESCKQTYNELPCALKFGMNLKEMEAQLKELSKNNSDIQIQGKFFIYKFTVNGKKYECNIIGKPSSHNPFDTIAPINEFCFIFDNSLVKFKGDKKELFENFKNEYKKLEFASCHFEYEITREKGKKWHNYEKTNDVYCWTTQNLAVLLTDYNVLSVTFYNAPETKPNGELHYIYEEIKEIGENEKQGKAARYRQKKYNSIN